MEWLLQLCTPGFGSSDHGTGSDAGHMDNCHRITHGSLGCKNWLLWSHEFVNNRLFCMLSTLASKSMKIGSNHTIPTKPRSYKETVPLAPVNEVLSIYIVCLTYSIMRSQYYMLWVLKANVRSLKKFWDWWTCHLAWWGLPNCTDCLFLTMRSICLLWFWRQYFTLSKYLCVMGSLCHCIFRNPSAGNSGYVGIISAHPGCIRNQAIRFDGG